MTKPTKVGGRRVPFPWTVEQTPRRPGCRGTGNPQVEALGAVRLNHLRDKGPARFK